MQSKATTVSQYLAELPPEQRTQLSKVRAAIKKHLPRGYVETMQHGMIAYVVPLELYPAGYLNKKDVPLPYVSLGAQKRHLALYLMNVYGNPDLERWFRGAWAKSGKKLDMGKSCVRFEAAGDLALDVVVTTLERTPVDEHIARYEATHRPRPRSR